MTEFKDKCYRCHEFGHRKSDCPQENKQKGKSGVGKQNKKRFNGNCDRVKMPEGANTTTEQPKVITFLVANGPELTHEITAFMTTGTGASGKKHVLDSGATNHPTDSMDGITNFRAEEGVISVANGATVKSIGTGDLYAYAMDKDGKQVGVVLTDVIVAPGMTRPLISGRRIDEGGGAVVISGGVPPPPVALVGEAGDGVGEGAVVSFDGGAVTLVVGGGGGGVAVWLVLGGDGGGGGVVTLVGGGVVAGTVSLAGGMGVVAGGLVVTIGGGGVPIVIGGGVVVVVGGTTTGAGTTPTGGGGGVVSPAGGAVVGGSSGVVPSGTVGIGGGGGGCCSSS